MKRTNDYCDNCRRLIEDEHAYQSVYEKEKDIIFCSEMCKEEYYDEKEN